MKSQLGQHLRALSLSDGPLSLYMSSSLSERCQSSVQTHQQQHTTHCFKGGCLVLNRAARVLGGACQQQSQLSGRSKMAELWTAVICGERCPLPDALAACVDNRKMYTHVMKSAAEGRDEHVAILILIPSYVKCCPQQFNLLLYSTGVFVFNTLWSVYAVAGKLMPREALSYQALWWLSWQKKTENKGRGSSEDFTFAKIITLYIRTSEYIITQYSTALC